jgi:hypothetical protein
MRSGVLELASPAVRIRIAQENLRNNPQTVPYWFHYRFEMFKEDDLYTKVWCRGLAGLLRIA